MQVEEEAKVVESSKGRKKFRSNDCMQKEEGKVCIVEIKKQQLKVVEEAQPSKRRGRAPQVKFEEAKDDLAAMSTKSKRKAKSEDRDLVPDTLLKGK